MAVWSGNAGVTGVSGALVFSAGTASGGTSGGVSVGSGHATGGKRGATRDIIKNKGLTPHRNKLDRNPRVKKKVKYAKKVKQARSSGLSGRQNTSVGGAGGYAGESTGINAKLSRSTRL